MINIILILLILLIVLVMIMLVYMFTGNIEARAPREIVKQYKLNEYEYNYRKVFTIEAENDKKTDKVILYLHGGSYVADLYREHWEFFKDLIKDTGCTIVVPDYPLTPKYKYSDVFGMMLPLYREIVKKVEKENLIVMGDSAGGGIALALMEEAGREDLMQPKNLILISPWLDVTMSNKEIDKVQKNDKMLNKKALMLAGIAYAGEGGMEKFLVNPINGPVNKLENVTIFTGTYDILNPDVHKFKEIAEKQNVEIDIRETKGAAHIWIIKKYVDKKYDDEKAKKAYDELIDILNS